jgi:hypothetical protein
MKKDEDMKLAFEAIFSALASESGINGKDIANIADTLKEKYNRVLKGPEQFSVLFIHDIEQTVRAVAEQFYNKSESKMKDTYKPTFIYTHYSFLERHLEQLIESKDGHACSADKSRHILKKYFVYAQTGKVDEFKMEKGAYWEPRFGTALQWMEFCDGIYQLYYGKIELYLKAYSQLLSEEKRTYEYTLHEWFIEFVDGRNQPIMQSYDRDTEPIELIRFKDKDYYIILNCLLGDYEDRYPDAPENLLAEDELEYNKLCQCNHFKMVPKCDVKRIYMKTSQLMM